MSASLQSALAESQATTVALQAAIATLTPTPTPAPTPTGTKGMSVGLFYLSGSALTEAVANLSGAGVKWVRMDYPWNDMEGTQGVYNTAAWDAATRAVIDAGMQVIGIIDYCPPWANGGNGPFTPPANMSDYAAFCVFLATRYGPMGVHHWEIWNEENGSTFWATPDPVVYTGMLAAAYPALKAADPEAFVILGGMATFGTDGVNYNARDFLSGIYAAGGRNYFDGVGFHPYCYPDIPGTVNGDNWTQMYETTPNLLGIMAANGDGAKQIWVTEFGCPTQPNTGALTETFQAQYLQTAYSLAKGYPWLAVLCWYTEQDSGTDPTNPQDWFGLIRADGSFKPAWTIYAND
jgi:hypothetical protein